MLLEWWYDPVSVPHLMLDDNNTAAGTSLPSLTVLPDALPNGGAITINLNFSLNPDSPKLKQVGIAFGRWSRCAEWDSRRHPLEGCRCRCLFSESHSERVKTPSPERPWTLDKSEPKLNPTCNMLHLQHLHYLLLLLPGGGRPCPSSPHQQQLQWHLQPDRAPQRPPCLLQPLQRVSNLGPQPRNLP